MLTNRQKIQKHYNRRELMQDIDGYWKFWPMTRGYLLAEDLRNIADHLDEKNADWDAEIRKMGE